MTKDASSLSRLSDTYKHAIVFLDNGGTLESLPKKNKLLRDVVERELKRRLMIAIRYKTNKNRKFRLEIYKKIKVPSNKILSPEKFYAHLGKIPYSTLKNLNK